MDDAKLREVFRRAAEIASVVPESMHEAAFNRALDALMGVTPTDAGEAVRVTRHKRAKPSPAKAASSDPVADLLAMERSKASEVDDAKGAMAKALALLLVAHRELDIDGLTSSQIASVLTDKFRWRVTRQALGEAMDRAGNRVDRIKDGRNVRYRIMEAGEKWLTEPAAKGRGEAGTPGGQVQSPTPRRKAKRRAKAGTKGDEANAQQHPEKGTPARRPTRGPKAAVEILIDAGWFATPRGLAVLRAELENRLALRFKATDLSPAMTRLLREGRLQRSKTESGQYEYHS